MKKSIVIIANSSSGLYNFRKMLIEELIKKGHSVTALTPFNAHLDELKQFSPDELKAMRHEKFLAMTRGS